MAYVSIFMNFSLETVNAFKNTFLIYHMDTYVKAAHSLHITNKIKNFCKITSSKESLVLLQISAYEYDVNLIFLMETIDMPWKWSYLSSNSQINFKFIKNNLHMPWDWQYVSLNKNIKCIDIENNPDLPWNWTSISSNPNITWNFYKENMDKPWDLEILCNNPNIEWDLEFIRSNTEHVYWYSLCKNKHISCDFIKYTCSKKQLYNISSNPNITIEYILNNLDLQWEWRTISRHANITFQIIKEHLDLPWNWEFISYNPNITLDIIRDNIDMPWNWWSLCYTDKLTWEFIRDNREKYNFNWTSLKKKASQNISYNQNITLKIVEENPDFTWDEHGLRNNRNILAELLESVDLKMNLIREWRAAKTIQKYWFRSITNPEYCLCIKRLCREFDEISRA